MIVYPSTVIRAWDAYTIQHEPVASLQLMERAATKAFEVVLANFPQMESVVVFCGTGNNGGDGLVIARLMHESGKRVSVFVCGSPEDGSPDFRANLSRLPVRFSEIKEERNIPLLTETDLVVDALLGTGIRRGVEGIMATVIANINDAGCAVASIDIPSGLLCDALEQPEAAAIVNASLTVSFQCPKPAFFGKSGIEHTGKLEIVDIGLLPEFQQENSSSMLYIDTKLVKNFYRQRVATAEKRDYGQVLIAGGSYGMTGAVAMAAKACLRSGAGITTLLAPKCSHIILQTLAPEAILLPTDDDQHLQYLPGLDKFDVIAVGPGLGRHHETDLFIEHLLRLQQPMVIDADALNIIAAKGWQQQIPKGSIITPHQREFERLFGTTQTEDARMALHIQKAKEQDIYILLKGPHSRVACPDGRLYVNSTGNPGMAKGGSGDVLTGIIAGWWARMHDVEQAALMGVFLHGLAADLAVKELHAEALLATDVINYLPAAFREINS